MTVYFHELRMTRRTMVVWGAGMACLNILCLLLFPDMKKQVADLNAIFSSLGSFSAALGMDRLNIGSLTGFFAIECGSILSLGGGLYAAWAGGSIVSKEEQGHTADFLFSHPISRTRILLDKLLALMTQILILNLIVYFADLLGIILAGESIPWQSVSLIQLASLLMQFCIGGLCFSISALVSSSASAISFGLTLLLYFLNLASNLNTHLEWLRWITPYSFCEGAWILEHGTLEWCYVFSSFVISACALGFALWRYSRKDLLL